MIHFESWKQSHIEFYNCYYELKIILILNQSESVLHLVTLFDDNRA